ncbi:MAG: glyoxalase [Burkholderiales bacterium]|nr:glyoxalase [Burkholderiales bacterium]
MTIRGILHASFLVSDLSISQAFYCGLLGLEIDASRPDLGFPGLWLDLGSGQQIHLMALSDSDKGRVHPEHCGRDRHVAFVVDDISELGKKLEAAGIAHASSRSGRRALFCRDPDGNALEFVERAIR